MRENRPSGSEGGEAVVLSDPYRLTFRKMKTWMAGTKGRP